MRNLVPTIIFITIVLVVDFYAFKSLKLIANEWQKTFLRNGVQIAYWAASIISYGLIIYAITVFSKGSVSRSNYFFFFMGFALLLLILVPKLIISIFHLVDDIVHLLRWLMSKLFIQNSNPGQSPEINTITRWQFLSKLGWLVAAVPFAGIIYGVAKGRFNFRVIEKDLPFAHLPSSFDGLKIVHISDIHIGSFFNNYNAVLPAIDKINALKPDLILFTGDIVNNYAEELVGWTEHLSKLKAKYGKFSILGNHDYGDYVRWSSEAEKAQNLETLKAYHSEMGFKLMLNEKVNFKTTDSEDIEIIGIENWGKGGFSKYGDLKKAMSDSDDSKFQILLSHDPSHWDEEVLDKTKIDLTLAGHTHGMQFGVEVPGLIKWSPVKYRYPRWGGLYTESKQHIYINRGLGYIGFPGRVGMPPEITVLNLKKA